MTTTPVLPAFSITTIETRSRRGMMASLVFDRPGTPDVDGVFAEIEFGDGSRMEFSRLDGETAWTCDAYWGRGSFPIFSNGFGARYCITKQAQAGLADALDAKAAEVLS